MLYRSKPQEVEAVQWDGTDDSKTAIRMFGAVVRFSDYATVAPAVDHDLKLMAGRRGAQGWVNVPHGHWIVRQPGDLTDHWPVDPKYFAAKYEPAR